MSNIFASSKGDRFAQVPHVLDANGIPSIEGAAARFSCTTEQIVSAGDHCILIGKVTTFSHRETAGRGYVNGQYFSLGLERAAFVETAGPAVCGAIIEDGESVLMVQTDAGLRPPHCTHAERGRLIDAMRETLLSKGISADLGQAYSVSESTKPRGHSTYFLATGHIVTPNTEIVAVPIADLAGQIFVSASIAPMMTRFALEHQTRNFALYLGDTETSAIHDLKTRI